MAEVLVGTSGWSYKDWVGSVYPKGTPAARMLREYSERFATVEAHNTFRRRPREGTLEGWSEQTPPTFRFAPKAHVAITHQRDMEGLDQRIEEFFTLLEPLGPRLGPVLFQLPHKNPDIDRLDRLLDALPASPPAAFELATGWHTADILDRLDQHGATLVVADTDDAPAPAAMVDVGACAYVRLRRQTYTDEELHAWADRLAATAKGGRPVYAFLRHEGDPLEALRLRDAVRG